MKIVNVDVECEDTPRYSKIYNGTSHAINIVEGSTFNPAIRKFTGGKVIMSIPSNGMLNAQIDTVDLSSILVDNGDTIELIPLFGKSVTSCDPIPAGYDIYIVSALYSTAFRKSGQYCNRIYTISDPVMSEDGNTVIGCRGICPDF